MFRKTEADGYLLVDHRASPGLPNAHTRRLGLPDGSMGEGTVFEGATHGCPHCHTPSLIIPKAARNFCPKCNAYVCDYCERARHDPDYQHITMAEVIDKMKTGRYTVMGSAHAPKLVLLESLGATTPPPTASIQTEDHGIRRLNL